MTKPYIKTARQAQEQAGAKVDDIVFDLEDRRFGKVILDWAPDAPEPNLYVVRLYHGESAMRSVFYPAYMPYFRQLPLQHVAHRWPLCYLKERLPKTPSLNIF